MRFFIDTANVEEIRKANDMGVICGVTTNPSLIAKEGRDYAETLKEIASIVDGPISGEVKATTEDAETMIEEGRAIYALDPEHMVVKIPMTAEGLKAIKVLSAEGIPTNCTLIFSANQALLAARAGATYVSPFLGRLDDINESGANLIVTGGYRPNDYVIAKADRTGSCVLCAAQNTYAVLRLLESFFSDHAPEAESGKAAQWMQMPNFLYKDDIAADWFRFYSDHFHGFQGFPIMSDDRTVYGNLDVIQSFSVPHSQKLASLLSDDVQTLCVDADTPMPRLAQRMILSNSPYATVIHDGHAAGFVYYTDVLRYFLFAKSEGGAPEFSSKLSFIPELSNEDRRVYEVNFTESERLETDLLTVPLFHLAAKKHIAHVGGSEYLPLSSSFVFSSAADAQSTLFLSTIISPASGHTIHVDAELYTEDKTIARAMLVFAKQ